MNQEERDKLLEKNPLFTLNIPISMWKDKEGKAYPVIAMPRKETCFNCYEEPFETEEKMKEYCDMAIATYENAIELFKLFKEGKIDHIYLFDSPEEYLKKAKKDNENKENDKKCKKKKK